MWWWQKKKIFRFFKWPDQKFLVSCVYSEKKTERGGRIYRIIISIIFKNDLKIKGGLAWISNSESVQLELPRIGKFDLGNENFFMATNQDLSLSLVQQFQIHFSMFRMFLKFVSYLIKQVYLNTPLYMITLSQLS